MREETGKGIGLFRYGEEEGEGVRSREHGEHARSWHPFPATCTLFSPPATHPPTRVTSPAAAAVCARTLRAENNAGAAEKGRERGGNGAGGGGGELVRHRGTAQVSGLGAPTRAAAGARPSGAGTPPGGAQPSSSRTHRSPARSEEGAEASGSVRA